MFSSGGGPYFSTISDKPLKSRLTLKVGLGPTYHVWDVSHIVNMVNGDHKQIEQLKPGQTVRFPPGPVYNFPGVTEHPGIVIGRI